MFTKQIYATLKLDEPGRFLKIKTYILDVSFCGNETLTVTAGYKKTLAHPYTSFSK